ncbi:transcriptional regulator [Pasteurellaceae bacterium LFhippo2]|nr:transcriptional regulator [Pasteurellaceae bacterium LFhippo2]
MNEAIKTAITLLGNQQALASACSVSQNAVSKWLNGGNVPLEQALKIEKATGFKVKAEDIDHSFADLLTRT